MHAVSMIRRGVVVAAAAWALLVRAGVAFAQYPGGQETPPDVAGEKFFRGQEGTARTGWDFLLWLLIALLLVVIGLALYYSSRRAARREG